MIELVSVAGLYPCHIVLRLLSNADTSPRGSWPFTRFPPTDVHVATDSSPCHTLRIPEKYGKYLENLKIHNIG